MWRFEELSLKHPSYFSNIVARNHAIQDLDIMDDLNSLDSVVQTTILSKCAHVDENGNSMINAGGISCAHSWCSLCGTKNKDGALQEAIEAIREKQAFAWREEQKDASAT